MRNLISALIIDPLKDEHDYSKVVITDTTFYIRTGEQGFDINVLTNTNNILSELNKFKGFDSIITVGDQSKIDFAPLQELSFEFRKKWVHIDNFDPSYIASCIISTFLCNINRVRSDYSKLFSIFTCTYKTSNEQLFRLYNSLLAQTYKNWNWYVLDDSPMGETSERLNKLHDPRIVVIRNVSNHGNIGFNKHLIAMACDGDYLVEVDHDDELTPDCLELLNKAFITYPDSDFVYSYALELCGDNEVRYDDGFALGLGQYRDMAVNGVNRHVALTPNINCLSVRAIFALPNHVRCWKSEFYRRIGGHNQELSVLDDMDLLIRTFLYGQMTLIDKVLYIQYQGISTEKHRRGGTAQAARFYEIQRLTWYLKHKYDKQIHERVLELGAEDPFWVDEGGYSDIHIECDRLALPSFNHTLLC